MLWTERADQSRIVIEVDTNILDGEVRIGITAGVVLPRSADEHEDMLADGLELYVT